MAFSLYAKLINRPLVTAPFSTGSLWSFWLFEVASRSSFSTYGPCFAHIVHMYASLWNNTHSSRWSMETQDFVWLIWYRASHLTLSTNGRMFNFSKCWNQCSPSSRPWVWAALEGPRPESSPPSRPWSSQIWRRVAVRVLLPTQECSGSGWWCAAPPLCSRGGWSSSGYDPLLSPTVKQEFVSLK